MKQLFQSVRTGKSTVEEVPAPAPLPGHVVVQNAASLVSAGTERMVLEFAEMSALQKAKARPDLVRQVLDKARREGVLDTLQAVRTRLDQPLSLGYSSAGTVIGVGDGVHDLKIGDRVACSGMNYASHAEIVSVPRILATAIHGERTTFEEAAFTTVGAIAMHGVRLAETHLGEVVAVIGLGLIGQLCAQLLRSSGCRVLGMDPNPLRTQLALQYGCEAVASSAEELRALVDEKSNHAGADAVLICAATSSNDPVILAGNVARARSIVVSVGAVGLEIPRKEYYEKEIDFRISRSYGPGRYDPEYEEKGRDYPISYVRWTESRNMRAFLQLVGAGQVNLNALVTHRFPIERAPEAYDLITGKVVGAPMGVLITYAETVNPSRRIDLTPTTRSRESSIRIGMLGAGAFATQVLLPAIKQSSDTELIGVSTATGGSARSAAFRFGFRYCTTEQTELFADPDINTVVIATRHHLHGEQVLAALRAGKHVFCEKPLCLDRSELEAISVEKRLRPNQLLMVGYNRRFSPMAVKLKDFFRPVQSPITVHYRVNAGSIPSSHWVQDQRQGGGRVLGEACHFVNFLLFMTGSLPVSVFATAVPSASHPSDTLSVTISFQNGSIGTVLYSAEGDKTFGKERVEVFGGGRSAALDDFRTLELTKSGKRQVSKDRLTQNKGHRAEWQAFSEAIVKGTQTPIPWVELVASQLATFAIEESVKQNSIINLEALLQTISAQ